MSIDDRYIDYDWTGSYNAAFEQGIDHGLTTRDAMGHADEIMSDYRAPTVAEALAYERCGLSFLIGIHVEEHNAHHVEVYTLASGHIAYRERWESAYQGLRGIHEGFITNGTTDLWRL